MNKYKYKSSTQLPQVQIYCQLYFLRKYKNCTVMWTLFMKMFQFGMSAIMLILFRLQQVHSTNILTYINIISCRQSKADYQIMYVVFSHPLVSSNSSNSDSMLKQISQLAYSCGNFDIRPICTSVAGTIIRFCV